MLEKIFDGPLRVKTLRSGPSGPFEDITPDGLVVRRTKFRKSRLVSMLVVNP